MPRYSVTYTHPIDNYCKCGHSAGEHRPVAVGACAALRGDPQGTGFLHCNCACYSQRVDIAEIYLPEVVRAGGCKEVAAALREARILPRGTRLSEVRRREDAVFCFPRGAIGVHCVRLTALPPAPVPAEVLFEDEEIEAAMAWHGGQFSMLYAIASTGALRRGSRRPRPDMTDEEWMTDLLGRLEREAEEALADATRRRKSRGAARDERKDLDRHIQAFENIARKCAEFTEGR